jgi:methyl-accepting chemotaxis protein
MNRKMNKRKWRNFLIRNDIQLRLAAHHLVFLLVVIGVVIVTALVPLYAGFQDSNEVLWSQYFSAKFFIVILERLMIASIGIFFFGFIYHVVVTHRFCGPLVSFGKTFQQITKGNLTRKVCLRRRDFLKHEANLVNDMLDTLSHNINDLKRYNHLLKAKIEQLNSSGHELSGVKQNLAEIEKLVDASENTLDSFNAGEIAELTVSSDLAN